MSSLSEVHCKLLFSLVLTAPLHYRTMVWLGQLHSHLPPRGVINTAELILKSPVVLVFSQFPMRNVMTSIITFLLHSLFSPSKQPGGDTEGRRKYCQRSFLFLFCGSSGGGGDPVKNHYIYLYSYKIKDYNTDCCMPIY